jgi:paraquat-inducible protein A
VLGVLLHAHRRGRRPPRGMLAPIRLLAPLRPWIMVEVFLLGAMVALSKLSSMADAVAGIGLYAYGLLMLALGALFSLTPADQLWRWVDPDTT